MERQDRTGASRGGGAGWAIAAILLVGLAGSGWAFRDKLGFGAPQAPATVAAVPAVTTPAAPPATPAQVAASPAVPAATPADAAQTAPQPAAETVPATAPDAVADTAAAAPVDAVADTEPSHTGIAGASGDVDAEEDVAAPDSESLGPLRRMAQARREQAGARDGTQLATAPRREERQPARPAGPPKVAVIALGDPAITGVGRQVVEEELMSQGFLVVEPDLVDGLDRVRDLPGAFGVLARAANVRAVVVIKADPIGQTQLNYYGQSDTMYSAHLTVRAYDVASKSPLGAGSRSKVDYTALNVDYNTREAVEPELRRLVSSLQPYRPRGSGG